MVDLHTHSNNSDGDLSPEMLINEARNRGLTAIALTDHDTLSGLESARTAALSLDTPFQFIPGIEVNINWAGNKSCPGAPGLGPGGEFHLLGLGINSPSPAFITAIEGLVRRREARNREILEKMHELSMTTLNGLTGKEAVWEELLEIAGAAAFSGSLGRPHFAALLIKRKFVKNISQAFSRYLGVGRPLYVPKDGLNFDEAVVLIRESGGIPVLAHPISLFIAWGRLPDLVKSLKEMGLVGLEAWHPTAKAGSCLRLETLAKSLGLYVTEGSDFHGAVRPDRRLGYSSKGRKINDSVLAAIPELYNP
ncbi:MAG: PHP domain-containing protein [Treponema sp.]|nr:PHP domain-containing protein [Treponema sp.]